MIFSYYKNNKKFLTRKTSSGKVLNEIDGLRALAIFMVLYFHSFGFLKTHIPQILNLLPSYFINTFSNGDNGVPLFFAISSFVLGLPFAKYHLYSGEKVLLKKYFIRRITRLQPTYFIVLLCFGFLYFLKSKYELTTLVQSFTLSNLYLHNIALQSGSFINYVAWSLEIEFQFYLILPALAILFKLPATYRRVLLVIGILSGSLFHAFFNQLPYLSLLNYYHYFLAGLLCLDLYLTKPALLNKKNIMSIVLGIISLFIIISQSPHQTIGVFTIPFATSLILLLALQNPFWNKLFSLNFLSKTGTMSYSMYLIHFQIIAIGGIPIIALFKQTGSYLILAMGVLILFAVIWFLSAFTFLLIEKPFMNPNWYKIKKKNR